MVPTPATALLPAKEAERQQRRCEEKARSSEERRPLPREPEPRVLQDPDGVRERECIRDVAHDTAHHFGRRAATRQEQHHEEQDRTRALRLSLIHISEPT